MSNLAALLSMLGILIATFWGILGSFLFLNMISTLRETTRP